MNQRPKLELYVVRGCTVCHRAERTLRQCERIRRLIDLSVLELGANGVSPPVCVVGGPTTVFRGTIVALGTPDCFELAERLEALLGVKNGMTA